jgi:hypothetical protein
MADLLFAGVDVGQGPRPPCTSDQVPALVRRSRLISSCEKFGAWRRPCDPSSPGEITCSNSTTRLKVRRSR